MTNTLLKMVMMFVAKLQFVLRKHFLEENDFTNGNGYNAKSSLHQNNRIIGSYQCNKFVVQITFWVTLCIPMVWYDSIFEL